MFYIYLYKPQKDANLTNWNSFFISLIQESVLSASPSSTTCFFERDVKPKQLINFILAFVLSFFEQFHQSRISSKLFLLPFDV